MPRYKDYINIGCNGFNEQVILNEEGYTIGPESDGLVYVLFSYGYYPGEHVNKEEAKQIFSDIFSHGSSNVMCHKSIMELCVKGNRQIFKKCMEKRIETLRARIMRTSNINRWRRAYENNLRNFIRLYESIKYECSSASDDTLVTKSSKELMNMVAFLILQAKNPIDSYKKYEPIDPKEFVDSLNDPNTPVITDELLKKYVVNYPEKIPDEIHAFLGNKEILQHHKLEVTLQILQTLQREPSIHNLLVKHGRAKLLEVTPDPSGTIRSIVTAIVDIHTHTKKELAEKLQQSGYKMTELSNNVKLERARGNSTYHIHKLKGELDESHRATDSLKKELSKLRLSDTKIKEIQMEMANLKRVFEETRINIDIQRRELEDEKLRSSTLTGSSLQQPSQVAQKQKGLDALIQQNRALEQKITQYSRMIQGNIYGQAPPSR
jgi:hypothetical protein